MRILSPLFACILALALCVDASASVRWTNASGERIPAPDWTRLVSTSAGYATVPARVCGSARPSDYGIHRVNGRAYIQRVDNAGPYWVGTSGRAVGAFDRANADFYPYGGRRVRVAVWCEDTRDR